MSLQSTLKCFVSCYIIYNYPHAEKYNHAPHWLLWSRSIIEVITVNTLRPRQHDRHFADYFKRIFLNENIWMSIKISLEFVYNGPINNNPALVQIMAWRRSGDKPLSEPVMVCLLTLICVTRPQWVNWTDWRISYLSIWVIIPSLIQIHKSLSFLYSYNIITFFSYDIFK